MKYVKVVIDNKSDKTDKPFIYSCSYSNVRVGSKVKVSFARSKKLRDGYVVSLIDDESEISDSIKGKIKEITEIDSEVSLNDEMIRTALWMRAKYLCRYIEAIKCFVPTGNKPVRRDELNSLDGEKGIREDISQLTDEQNEAVKQISEAIEQNSNKNFLIHGVTGSGKTEVYIRAARAAIKEGKGVIILVPEIALTGQITDRFIGNFGENSVAILHSKISTNERYDQWQRIRKGNVRIVIGARSAVFAPIENLGLIVVDEEHEATYKSDKAPKVDTTEVAMKRLQDKDNNGVLVLGSATPSVVTYSRAKEDIYKLIELTKRYNDVKMPRMEVIDMRSEMKDGNKSVISRRLAAEMKKQLDTGKQVMLFLNRRGYSSFISCRECGYIAKCPTCGLSLTHHKTKTGEKLICHYCGHEENPPTFCPKCGSRYVKFFGCGTEKIEEVIKEMFPDKKLGRADLDTAKTSGELKKIFKAFEKGQTDILIGTQLIAKGLDFKNVGLMGIISADVTLNIPDFRAPERAFQLITQAAGRSGRGEEEGHVIVQTYSPEHYAIVMAAKQDYAGFYEAENKFRKYMMYPPYSDIFRIIFTSTEASSAKEGADKWHHRIEELLGSEDAKNLFSPQEAYMNKVNGKYRYSLVVKCPKGKRREYTELIFKVKNELSIASKKKQDYIAAVDVNPYSFS